MSEESGMPEGLSVGGAQASASPVSPQFSGASSSGLEGLPGAGPSAEGPPSAEGRYGVVLSFNIKYLHLKPVVMEPMVGLADDGYRDLLGSLGKRWKPSASKGSKVIIADSTHDPDGVAASVAQKLGFVDSEAEPSTRGGVEVLSARGFRDRYDKDLEKVAGFEGCSGGRNIELIYELRDATAVHVGPTNDPGDSPESGGAETDDDLFDSLRSERREGVLRAQESLDIYRAELALRDVSPEQATRALRLRASEFANILGLVIRTEPGSAAQLRGVPRVLLCERGGGEILLEDPDLSDVSLSKLRKALSGLDKPTPREVQGYLCAFEGVDFGDIEVKREFARAATAVAQSVGCSLLCSSCGEPASSLSVKEPRKGVGVFRFRHNEAAKRSNHGAQMRVPTLLLVPNSVT